MPVDVPIGTAIHRQAHYLYAATIIQPISLHDQIDIEESLIFYVELKSSVSIHCCSRNTFACIQGLMYHNVTKQCCPSTCIVEHVPIYKEIATC
jgi:hypothetical protein